MKVDLARETALKILYDINEKEAYSNISLNRYLGGDGLKVIDRAFITELVYGTVSWKLTIDYLISKYSSIRLNKLSPWILNILRLGIYQLLHMDRVPASAACNESVALARKYGHKASSGFVNAVLRNIVRNGRAIDFPDREKLPVKYLSTKYSHPEWMVEYWLQHYGESFTEELLVSNNQTPEFTIRVNRLKATRENLGQLLAAKGIQTVNGKYLDEALILKNPSSISSLKEFQEGLFQVQDESSMLVGKILDPRPGSLAVDVCSAPGGKATHIAELMNDTGTVVARDIHEHKIKLIDEAARRLGLTSIKCSIFDAAMPDPELRERADYVLVDAPCTGLGIIRKKPDIKWARNEKDRDEITELQKKILEAASTYVKTGGTLVYSTCTIRKEENEDIVKAFVQSSTEFILEDLASVLPSALSAKKPNEGYIQLFPHINGIDGFFIAKMKRKS